MSGDDWRTLMDGLETDVDEQPFPTSEYRRRYERTQRRIADRDLDALLVTTPENIFYLTGFDTTGYYAYQTLVVPTAGDPELVVRRMEGPNVIRSWIPSRREYGDLFASDSAVETTAGVRATVETLEAMELDEARVGVERDSWFLTLRQFDLLREAVGTEFTGVSDVVEAQRAIKSERELDYIERAGAIVETGMEATIDRIEAGVHDYEVAAEAYASLVRNGSEQPAGQPYITSGRRSALPHSRWKGRTIEKGDLVWIELGAAVDRYHAAQIRTAYVGEDPPAEVRTVSELGCEALAAAIDAMEPGVAAGDVDRAGRRVLEEAGYGRHYPHRVGYSIGVGYPPGWGEGHIVSLGPGDETELREDMVFHMPVNVYIPEHGQVGVSATVRVTGDGAEPVADVERGLFLV